jgi:zinc finger SWIM domain-containing protein 3
MNITGDFSACMFKYEDKSDFENAFNELKSKLGEDNTWLKFIYGCKEKWAYCFMRDALPLGIRSTQASESINADLKDYLSCKLDIYHFLENFDSILDKKRDKEI